ncbi:2830_t:CDS:2 [Ambispora gerdemannii]|uniref:COP9 signalosome complex subunit 8 n=1 Tax=Ambispora gerdemannii TaxID=144530 RepID=A0A9N9FFD2_9GLOM|nr:2830_t:CDS:2 [Ambispora gerdemannii]
MESIKKDISTSKHEELIKHISAGKYEEVIKISEDLEYTLALAPNSEIPIEEVYAPYLAAYLILNQLPAAKFLWKRIPERQKTDEIRAIWNVGTALWNREFENVYGLIEGKPWSSLVAPLMTKLAELVRERVLDLLSEAYSSIAIDKAAQRLGLPQEQLIQVLTNRGWVLDAATKTLQPKTHKTEIVQNTSFTNFSRLTDLVIQLEKS